MAAFNKFNQFVQDLANKVHNLGADALKVALTNSAPVATNAILTDLTEILYTNCSSRAITTTSSTQTSGTLKLLLVDLVLTASGTVGPFRYITLWNDTPTSPADPLIGFYDYGSSITLATGETFTIDFDGSAGVLTIQ